MELMNAHVVVTGASRGIGTEIAREMLARGATVTVVARSADALAALDGSRRMRGILGDPVVDALVAVRRYEQQNYSGLTAADAADRFRMAWSL